MAIALFLNLKRKGEISVNFLYELLLKIVSIARGYILCSAGSVQNNTYQNRKAPFEESGAATSSEVDRQRGKARRFRFIRIAFIIFIILLCLILAFASPLRCFALGYASETIVELILSALAGTAAYAFAAAGGAELIACLLIGMGASITVSVIAAAINTAVECGAWQDFVINCQNNFEIRKNQGTMALAMGGTAFLYAYDWVKKHILGISLKLDSNNVNKFDGMTFYGTNTLVNDNLSVFKYKVNDNLSYQDVLEHRGFGLKHYVDIISGNIFLRFSSDSGADFSFGYHGDVNKYLPNFPVVSSAYSPIFNSKECKIANHIVQNLPEGKVVECSDVKNANLVSAGFYNSNGDYCNLKIEYHSDSGQVCVPYDSKIYFLKLKDGSIIYKFKSINDFAYKLFYESVGINWSWYGYIGRENELSFTPVSSTVSKPVELPVENKKYYDKDRDTIATTAGSVRTKVKDGSITSDTDGKVSVKVNSPAIPAEGSAAAVTPTTKINESVKVTDISTTLEGVQTMNPGDAITIGSNNIQIGAQSMGDKLPFSALKTISNMMNTLFISKTDDNKVKAPVIPVNFKVLNQHIKFDIDFSPLDPYVGLVRIGLSVSFLITTYLCFKKWLVNKEL